jgi:hypothetical protein
MWRVGKMGLVVALAGTAGGSCSPDGALVDQPVGPGAAAVSRESQWRTYDDYLAALTSHAPGFGGVYRAEGRVVVLVTAAADINRVTEALRTSDAPIRGLAEAAAEQRLTFVTAEYDFRELLDWRRRMGRDWRPPGVVAFDVDEAANRIRIFLQDASVEEVVRARAAELGIPQAAVVTLISGPFVHDQDLDDRFRPIPGGVMVRRYAAGTGCTSGAIATTDAGLGFLTATHCTPTPAGLDYAVWYQNTNGSSDEVGVEYFDPEPIPQGAVCNDPQGCRFSDAAFILFDDDDDAQYGYLARTEGLGSRDIGYYARFNVYEPSPGLLSVGDTVYLMGQVTGWSVGEIQYTCVDIANAWDGITLRCQGMADYESTGGDSGGTVFTWPGYGSDVEISGIHSGHFTGGQYDGLRVFSWWLYIALEFSEINLGVGN